MSRSLRRLVVGNAVTAACCCEKIGRGERKGRGGGEKEKFQDIARSRDSRSIRASSNSSIACRSSFEGRQAGDRELSEEKRREQRKREGKNGFRALHSTVHSGFRDSTMSKLCREEGQKGRKRRTQHPRAAGFIDVRIVADGCAILWT